MYENISLNSP